MAKFSLAERRSFKKGMQAQYSKEHPLLKYGVLKKTTYYNEDGSIFSVQKHTDYFRTLKEANAHKKHEDNFHLFSNQKTLDAVKKKKVSFDNDLKTFSVVKLDKPVRK